ncbi:hypothetical protein MMC08_008841 [Hypocenomyce scalaris]|nr:hypothetical protein [Hypocenomyce scalaris]
MAVMAGKSAYQRQTIFARFKTVQKHRGTGSWITFEEGKQLCDELGLTTTLQPLFDLGQRLNRLAQQKPYQDQQQQSCKDQEQQSSQDQEQQSCQDQEQQSCQGPSIISRSDSFVPVRIGEKVVMIRERDLKINATHILNVAGLGRRKLTAWRKDLQNLEIVRGYGPVQGTYVDYQVGLRLCHQHRLKKLEQRLRCSLRTLESYPGGPVQDQPAIQYLTGSRPLGPSAFSSDLSRDPALPERSEHDLAEGLLDQRYIHNASSRSLMHSAPGNERGFLPQECSGSVVGHVEDSKHSSLDSWLDRGAVLGEGSQSSTRSDSTSQGSRETSVSVDSLNLEDLNAEAVERSLTDSWLHGRSITRSTNSLAHIKGRQDARSEITEPSFRNGSFVPPLKDSFLLPGA